MSFRNLKMLGANIFFFKLKSQSTSNLNYSNPVSETKSERSNAWCVSCSMGLSHDGLDNDCDPDPSDGKVMSAMVQSSFNKYHWTRCSREKLAEVLP